MLHRSRMMSLTASSRGRNYSRNELAAASVTSLWLEKQLQREGVGGSMVAIPAQSRYTTTMTTLPLSLLHQTEELSGSVTVMCHCHSISR